MSSLVVLIIVLAAVALLGIAAGFWFLGPARRRSAVGTRSSTAVEPKPGVDYRPGVGDDAEVPRDTPTRSVSTTVELPELDVVDICDLAGEDGSDDPSGRGTSTALLERPEPTAGRLVRLRSRLARSQTSLGRGLLAVLGRDRLDDDAWDEIEELLITADVGVGPTMQIVERLKERTRVLGTRTPEQLKELLTEELVAALQPELDRSLATAPTIGADGVRSPAVVLVVGVNGTGKTTTCGKLARVLVADDNTVLLGAADTFRAAAADQLQTWGERVGARTVRGPEGGDPASVAFDAVAQGKADGVDVVLIDTAGRLHNKVGLMDELGKVKRVVERQGAVSETLLVLDAATGQNGLMQARVFTEVVDVTGIVLTKLDGTAKGGIVISVQRELGVPVKLIGLGEGPDDLAPFDSAQFVDALLG